MYFGYIGGIPTMCERKQTGTSVYCYGHARSQRTSKTCGHLYATYQSDGVTRTSCSICERVWFQQEVTDD